MMPSLRSARHRATRFLHPLCLLLILLAVCATPLAAQAALHARGSDMVYDDGSDLTWVTNALFGNGSVFDDGVFATDGRMSYASAQAWVAQLAVPYPTDGRVITDWELPSAGALQTLSGHSAIYGLLYDTLANTRGALLTDVGPFGNIPGSLANPGGFFWLDAPCDTGCKQYYSSISVSGGILTVEGHLIGGSSLELALALLPAEGFEGPAVSQPGPQAMYGYAWAMRRGDVAVVPIPESALLFVLGSAALLSFSRRSPT